MTGLANRVELPEPWATRAKAISPARHEGADPRVELVLDMMAHGIWQPKLARELAQVWSIGVDAVQQYSSAASRVLRLQFAPERNEEIRGVVLARLWTLGNEARDRTEEVVDAKGEVHTVRRPDMRTALAAVIGFAEVMGIKTNKHEVRVSPTELSDAELHQKLAELVGENPQVQEKLAAMGFRKEVVTQGEEVPPDAAK